MHAFVSEVEIFTTLAIDFELNSWCAARSIYQVAK